MDYGLEWEAAWEAHVNNWVAPEKSEGAWITAKEANEQEKILPDFISDDLRRVTNHSHLFTACNYQVSREDKHRVYRRPDDWQSLDDDEILQEYSDSGEHYEEFDYSIHDDDSHWPCAVLGEEDDGSYIVRILNPHFDDDNRMPWAIHGLPRILRYYPRSAIHYFVKPYETDQQMKHAFRHAIGIPDEIFPRRWKTPEHSANNISEVQVELDGPRLDSKRESSNECLSP